MGSARYPVAVFRLLLFSEVIMTTTETKDYSQFGEQPYILDALGETVGRFLEIGAYHPTQFSNTRALVDRGWSGVMIEPAPGPFLSLLREYGNDERFVLINAALGFHRNMTRLWATDDAVSTTQEANYEQWKPIGGFYGSFFTPVVTLFDVFNQFGGGYDFVSIDTEGTSVDVFHELLKTDALPMVVCVEHDGRSVECQQAAHGRGYTTVHINQTNLVVTR